MYNFYTHHILELVLYKISDGYVRVIGTLRVNNIKGFNKSYVQKAINMLYVKDKGSWTIFVPVKQMRIKLSSIAFLRQKT